MRFFSFGLAIWAAGAFAACDSDVEFGNSGGGGSGGSGSAQGGGTTVTSSSTGGSPDVCPPEEPRDGGPCMKKGLLCEYGDGPLVSCRNRYECSLLGVWSGTFVGCSPHPDQAGCPASEPAPNSQCPEEGKLCLYDEDATQCGCTSCFGGPCMPPPAWLCVDAPGGGCPPEAPNYGQACATEGLACSYGACGINTQAQRNCSGGVWVDIPVMCPL